MSIKRKFSPQQKASIALAAVRGEKTMSQLSSLHQVHQTQIKRWRKTAEDNITAAFIDKRTNYHKEQDRLIDELYKIIGKRDTELSWLKKKLSVFNN